MKGKPSYKLYFTFLFVLFGTVLLSLLLSICGYMYLENQDKRVSQDAASYLQNRSYRFKQFIQRGEEQLLALSSSHIFQYFVDEGSRGKAAATELFVAIARANPSLMQVRYLDVSGKEVIRVQRSRWGEPVEALHPSKLQSKGHRYYFKETIGLAAGTLWHSRLDLNVEEKKVELPHRPTIRIATPVYCESNNLKGIVILNLLMDPFLEEWRQIPGFDLYLVDGEKRILLHPDRGKDWTLERLTLGEEDASAYRYSTSLYSRSDQKLTLVLHVPAERQQQLWFGFMERIWWGILIVAVMAVLLALPVARIPERLYRRLFQTNQALEKKVREKTASLQATNDNLEEQITRVKHKEHELRIAYENASRTAKARSEFLGVVSHELRTPLNAIINFTELIRDDFDDMLKDPALQDEAGMFLERISVNANQLLGLINNILDISRIESGNFSYHIVTAPLNHVFREAVEHIKEPAAKKRLHIESSIPQNDLWAKVDTRRFFQILLNLLANAVKFTDRGGEVWLEVKDQKSVIEVVVRDTGRGIPEALQDAIFHSFSQVDRFDEGIGLGLGLVKQMCEDMEIKLSIESEEGKGSTFRLLIPSAGL